jgi:transposase
MSAKTYPGEVWLCGPGRATFTPDYGRRGSVWVLGAFEPATGLATTLCSPRRDSASFIQLLEQVLQTYPAQEWVLVTDNLSTHRSRETQVALLAWPEVTLLFIPKYACWLNLIEPWWKQLRNLALKGRRFERIAIPMSGKKLLNFGKGPLRRRHFTTCASLPTSQQGYGVSLRRCNKSHRVCAWQLARSRPC